MTRSATLALLALALAAPTCRRRENPFAIVPLVAPGRDAGRSARDGSASRRPRATPYRPITDRPAPRAALGVDFGTERAALLARYRAITTECRDRGRFVFCPRALAPLAVGTVVTYEFCRDRVCGIAIDGTRTRDEELMAREYERLVGLVRADLGEPVAVVHRVGQGCTGHLPLCLTSRQAEFSARWAWTDGPQVSVTVDQLEDDALMAQAAVTWLSAEGVSQAATLQDEIPDASPPSDGSAPDAR